MLRTAWAEVVGLFVDDGLLAGGALLWVAVVALVLSWLGSPALCAALLFLGLAAILAASVLRA